MKGKVKERHIILSILSESKNLLAINAPMDSVSVGYVLLKKITLDKHSSKLSIKVFGRFNFRCTRIVLWTTASIMPRFCDVILLFNIRKFFDE